MFIHFEKSTDIQPTGHYNINESLKTTLLLIGVNKYNFVKIIVYFIKYNILRYSLKNYIQTFFL